MDKEKILSKISNYSEMNPDQHDGSYELVRETVGAYADCSLDKLDYNDLNLVYLMSVGTWKHGFQQKEKCINLSNLSSDKKEHLVKVLNRVKANAENKRYENSDDSGSVGMFGTGFYTFSTKTDNESVSRFIKLCVDISTLEDDNIIYDVAEKALSVKVKGMQSGAASMVLHCLKPYTFPILNGNMGNDNLFKTLGVSLKKIGDITEYISNCCKIKAYRDENFEVKNYRIFDMAAWDNEENQYKDKILKVIEQYKNDFVRINKEEIYKWEAVKWYKDHWKIDEPNFAMMLKTAFSKAYNLLTSGMYYPYKMAYQYAEKEPEKVRSLFKMLYDEDIELEQRIIDFRKGFEEYTKPLGLNHYQDLHAITVYLTFEYPQNYYIYKYSIYKGFKELIDYEETTYDEKSEISKLDSYYEICDYILEAVQDTEVTEISQERLNPETCYMDEKFTMLAMDIAYFGSKLKKAEYWPSLDEYNPGISVEMWRDILADKTLTPDEMLDILAKMLEIGGESTCYHMAEVYGKTHNYYNAMGSNFGKRVKDRYNLPDCYDSEYDRMRYYTIPFVGRDIIEDNKTHYSWKLRDELKEALEGMDLTVNVDATNKKEFDKNIILYGPPGTGKTYNTAIYAVAIIENKSLEEVSSEDYFDVLERYNEYKKDGRIEFTTFHQSYGYEEFIEGIKPIVNDANDDNNKEVVYDVVPGVFKAFCDKIERPEIKGSVDTELNDYPTVWKVSLEGTGDNPTRRECLDNDHIRVGYDECGEDATEVIENQEIGYSVLNRFINEMSVGDVVISCYTASTIDAIGVVTGEYEWNDEYEYYKRLRKVKWLVKGINENIVKINNGKKLSNPTVHRVNITLSDVMDIVKKHSPEVIETENKGNYVFIIDEINRGNISKILGELITLIEAAKRKGQPEEMQVKLPYSQKEFGVPDNVYIIGTMNTADRSIAAIDTALRRRFSFREMLPQADVLDGIEVDGLSVSNMLKKMNRRIEVLYDREHTIGHAYFMPLQYDNSIECLADIFKDKIIPLLQEYFYEDYEKIRLVLGDNQKAEEYQFILKEQVDETELFGEDTDVIEEAYKYSINEEAFTVIDAYEKMI